MIYLVRFIISTCIITVLVKANVWLSPLCNIILVVGYRSFLLLSPFLSKITRQFSLTASLFCAGVGALLFCFHQSITFFCGAIFLSMGVSIASYLIRFHAAYTAHGTAYNKIAGNIGGVASGGILLFVSLPEIIFFKCLSIAFFIASFLSFFSLQKSVKIKQQHLPSFELDKIIGWFLLGVGLGVFVFACNTILPQYMIAQLHYLPAWYGMIIMANCALVIVFQLFVIRYISKLQNGFLFSAVATTIGLLMVAFPSVFHAEIKTGALLWIFVYTLIECVISFFDVFAKKYNTLLIKETAIGIGGGLSVLVMRMFASDYSTAIVGLAGIFCIFLSSQLIIRRRLFRLTNISQRML